jgi:hypothetical protein
MSGSGCLEGSISAGVDHLALSGKVGSQEPAAWKRLHESRSSRVAQGLDTAPLVPLLTLG